MGFHFGTIVAVAVACASLSAPYTGVDAAPGQNLRQLQTAEQDLGCFVDRRGDRILQKKTILRDDNSFSTCSQICLGEGLPLVGLENGVQCWCGEDIEDTFSFEKSLDCEEDRCPGNADEFCGGFLAINLFRIELLSDEGPSDYTIESGGPFDEGGYDYTLEP